MAIDGDRSNKMRLAIKGALNGMTTRLKSDRMVQITSINGNTAIEQSRGSERQRRSNPRAIHSAEQAHLNAKTKANNGAFQCRFKCMLAHVKVDQAALGIDQL